MSAWVPFYVGDWERDTRHLTIEQDGMYFRLVRYIWATGNELPLDLKACARIVGAVTPRQKRILNQILIEFFIKTETGHDNVRARILVDEQNAKIARLKETGRLGGVANAKHMLKQKLKHVPKLPEPQSEPEIDHGHSMSLVKDHDVPATAGPAKKEKKPRSKSVYKFEDRHMAFAIEFRDIILGKFPFYPQPNLDSWADTVRKIEQIDGYTIQEMEEVTNWALFKSDFWWKNIHSPETLRKQFVKLINQSGLYAKWEKRRANPTS